MPVLSRSAVSGVRVARLVAAVASCGFAFGGFVGIVNGDPAERPVATALLVALLALHLRNCVRWSQEPRPAGWPWTLAAQVVLTVAGMIWFADTWYGNSGFAAAAFLLLIRRRWLAWTCFGVVLAAQAASTLAEGFGPAESLYLAIGQAAFAGIVLYVVARLADMVTDLQRTRASLAEAAVARERAAFTKQLGERVAGSLEGIVAGGRKVLESGRSEDVRERLAASVDTARAALKETRSVAHGHRGERPSAAVADDLTTTGVTVLGVMTICLMIVPNEVRRIFRVDVPVLHEAIFWVALAAFLALFLRACVPGRPVKRAALMLFALGIPAVAPLLIFELDLWHPVYFLPGAGLVLLSGWMRWVAVAVLLGGVLALWNVQLGDSTVLSAVYEVVWISVRALVVYGLVNMGTLVVALKAARAELARTEVARERLRFAGDLHDLLGLRLSVVVLKSDLAFRLAGRDAERARTELSAAVDAARQALAELGTIVSGPGEMSVAQEVGTATAALSAAGVSVRSSVSVLELDSEADAALAAVLREGTANIVWHSSAVRAELVFEEKDGVAWLRLTNDGVSRDAVEPGIGLESLAGRMRAVGGELTSGIRGDRFVLEASVPLQPPLIGGDLDGVDPVAGVELHER
ncbi:sensor histidine kinase [Nonomuraea sp. NPDC049655]|uniref:sensor histidine kinase n=1 Tax=Nonomuraea sp. NPDC049655 TaxID=3364355 RepID=UPI00379A8141